MINRIVLVGRLTTPPALDPRFGCCAFGFQISHSGPSQTASEPFEVDVLVPNQRRAEVVQKFLDAGNYLLVTGHLAPSDGATRIEMEDFQFLPDELRHVDLREEAWRDDSSRRAA